MLKAIAFIIAVWIALNLVAGSAPTMDVNLHGMEFGGFAGGLLAAGTALAALVLAIAALVAVLLGLVVVAIGVPIFIVAIVLCAVLAPVWVPVVILVALAFAFCTAVDGLFA